MSTVPTYPPAEPHVIMTSTPRVRTEPAFGGFMQSVMRHHDVDLDDRPEKKHTQEEQDAEDEKARKRAMKNLINSWQERLQLISVITTFFASTEAALLVNTKPFSSGDWENSILQVSNASLLGALIVHAYASILSFLGAFLLISYKLREATREEMIAEGITMENSPLEGSMSEDVERGTMDMGLRQTRTSNDTQSTMRQSVNYGTATSAPERNKKFGLYSVEPPIFSANPHVEQVIPFLSNVSSHRLLSRTHALCVFLAAAGFIFAIVGILSYAWALQPRAVSIFASACLGGAVLTTLALGI